MPSYPSAVSLRELAPGTVGVSDANDQDLIDEANQVDPMLEVGTSGLKRAAGYVDEEFLPELKGRKAVQIYREMGDNDPICGTMLFALTYILCSTKWTVKEGGRDRDAANAARFLESCMEDMSHSWGSMVQEILSCLQYGWSWHEPVFKYRMGPWETDGRRRSNFDDGMIGIRKVPIRSQETMQRWVFDENNETTGMIQMAPPDYRTRPLPLDRSLLFRIGQHKGNPEGYSFLRRAYRPWFFKKRMEEHEAIGVERDLAGLPVVSLPPSYLRAKEGSHQAKMVAAMRTMVRSVRRNEQEGVLFPLAYDEDVKQPEFKFELMSSGGARQFSTNEIIQRYEQRILMTCLADFILVGHEDTGTYNMHLDKRGIFNQALNTVMNEIAFTLNRHLVPKLFMKNRWRPSYLPKFMPDDVDAPDLGQLAEFLSATAGIGFPWGPDADVERFLRRSSGLPEMSRQDYDKHKQLARRTEATRMLETQTAYLQAKQQLAQIQVASVQMATGENTPDHVGAVAGAAQQAAAGQQADAQAQADGQQGQVDDARAQDQHDAAMASSQMDLMGKWQQLMAPSAPSGSSKSGGSKKK